MLDMFKRKFSIGGYNFDDWSLVKELYVPTDVSSGVEGPDRSLHVRGREDFPGSTTQINPALNHHLQHYVIPYGKAFMAFAVTNVKIDTTSGIGLFGTGKAYGRYPVSHQPFGATNPGAPIAWSGYSYILYGVGEQERDYYHNDYGSLVLHHNRVYECKQTHAPDPNKEPLAEGDTDWWKRGSVWDADWKVNTFYFHNELELVTVEDIKGAYMCMVDHESSDLTKPCSGVNWDYGDGEGAGIWNPGDEFQADLSSQFGFSESCLNVSKGTDMPFSKDIIAVFTRSSEDRLRRIDAKTSGGTMKAGATLWGIEVAA